MRWAVLAGLCALTAVFVKLPLLSVAENRLALGRPIYTGDGLGLGTLGLGAGLIGLAILGLDHRRSAGLLAGAAFVVALLLLAEGLGGSAARSLAGLAPAARVSLGAGSWLALASLVAGLTVAVRRADRRGLGLAVGGGLIAAVAVLGHLGRFDAVSLAVEYAARREAVHAAFAEHFILSGSSLALAMVGAILLSLWRRGQGVVAILLGGIQVVPAVALLGGLVAVTAGLLRAVPGLRDLGVSALGATPAILGIAAYLLLPLWRGLALSLNAPDPATLEAARAVGLSPRQVLARIRLPLGAPVLVGSLRVAAVQSLGLATLGALVGAGGLGRIVLDGMAQFAPDLILLGAIPVIGLSLCAETGLSRLETAARRRWHA